jgi:hypothetical protein
MGTRGHASVDASGGRRGSAGTGHCGRREWRRSRSLGSARPGRAGRLAGYPLSPSRRDADPPGVSTPPDSRDRDRAEWYANLYEVGWPDAPQRAIHNSTAEMWEAAGEPPPGSRPGEGEVIPHFASGEPILRYSPAPRLVGTTGEIEALSLWAGQSVALAKQSQPAAEIVAELVSRL